MDSGCASLALTPSWREEQLLLVRATDAIRLCREGAFEALSAQQSFALLGSLGQRDMASVREFVVRARLLGPPLSDYDDAGLLTLIRNVVRGRDLVALHGIDGDMDAQGGSTTEQRRLVRAIEASTRNRLTFSGGQYKLVADLDLRKLPDRDSYEVVRHDDAARILDGLAAQTGQGSGELAALLAEAREKLTRDWRPPFHPDGIILVRKISRVEAHAPTTGPAFTPSQIKKLATKTDWIEIQVKDDLGKPYTGRYRIELPDGSVVDGHFDKDGLWGNYEIETGKCKVICPDVPDAVKPGDASQTTWIAVRVVDENGKLLAGHAYTLKLSDGSERRGKTIDGEVRVDGIAPGTCVFSLQVDGEAAGADAPSVSLPAALPVSAESLAAPDQFPSGANHDVLQAIVKDDDGHPLANLNFEAHFADGTVVKGQTDESGKVYRENCPSGPCELRFSDAS